MPQQVQCPKHPKSFFAGSCGWPSMPTLDASLRRKVPQAEEEGGRAGMGGGGSPQPLSRLSHIDQGRSLGVKVMLPERR
jgi:hypothetical protein